MRATPSRLVSILAVTFLGVFAPRVARGQYYGPVDAATRTSFLIGLGVAIPAGGIASRVDPDIAFLLGLQVRQAGSTLGFRFDGMFTEFSGPNGYASIDALTFDAVAVEHKGLTHFYGILGLGPYYAYGSGFSGTYVGYRSSVDFGLNGGGGISYGRKVGIFLEVRYHLVFHGDQIVQMIPIIAGVGLPAF